MKRRMMVTFRMLNKDKDAWIPDGQTVGNIKDGFWVLEGSDGLYKIVLVGTGDFWIPPSQILLVGKHNYTGPIDE